MIYSDKTARAVCLAMMAIVYCGSGVVNQIFSGLVSIKWSQMLTACSNSGALMFVALLIIDMMDEQLSMTIFLVLVGIFVGIALLIGFVQNPIRMGRLRLSDQMLDNSSVMESIKKVNTFVNLIVEGFRSAHPVCLNWSLLKFAYETWPKSQYVWFTHTKFVAIYPEEARTLAWVHRMVRSTLVHGTASRTIKAESLNITRQRESALTLTLKRRLMAFSLQATTARH